MMRPLRTISMNTALVWLRRDLRLTDQAALSAALAQARRVACVFVFDPALLEPLPRQDRRVEFILASLAEFDSRLRQAGGGLWTLHEPPETAIPLLARELRADAVFANEDYEPAAIARDLSVQQTLVADGRRWLGFKDQVIYSRSELLTGAGRPYSVFTPYKRSWLAKLDERALAAHPVAVGSGQWLAPTRPLPSLGELGFAPSNLNELPIAPGEAGASAALADFLPRLPAYAQARDYPSLRGPSYLSVHLRFGTISVRQLVRAVWPAAQAGEAGAASWLSELIWRDFYQQLLWHHPHLVDHAFRPEFDKLEWDEAPELWKAWTEGATGYPLVDAAIAQIRATGYMHNRLRMLVASFLTKDLGLDWRLGEAWFALQLNDIDLAANNGGWQWAASTGCDAQPWFRIFNPVTQSRKFDPEGRFIKRYLPQLAGFDAKEIHAPWLTSAARQAQAGCVIGRDYPAPVVDHASARERTLARFARALEAGKRD